MHVYLETQNHGGNSLHTYSAWRQQSMKRVELIPGRNPMWFRRAGMKIFRPFALTAASYRQAGKYEGKFDITPGNLSHLDNNV